MMGVCSRDWFASTLPAYSYESNSKGRCAAGEDTAALLFI